MQALSQMILTACRGRAFSTAPTTAVIRLEANPLNYQAYDEVLDVRTPAEFADDHLPGAVNLPLLGDADRVEVGRTFAESPFAGRRLGASMIAARIGGLLASHFADKGLDYNPLIYCWRGGQRSHALATVLSQVGYSPVVLSSGYRAYRRQIVDGMGQLVGASLNRLVVLAGLTGSGKTELLGELAARGEQVIDLEQLANHRGSILGQDPEGRGQPSQKSFESALYHGLAALDPGRPVWLECESPKIGRRFLPLSLVARIRSAPRVLLDSVDTEARIRRLTAQYAWLTERPADLSRCLLELGGRHHSEATLAKWLAAAAAGDTAGLASQLLSDHYDPVYLHSRSRYFRETDPALVARVPDEPRSSLVHRVLAARDRLLELAKATDGGDDDGKSQPPGKATAAAAV